MPGEGAVVCQRTKTLKTPFSRVALSLRAKGGSHGPGRGGDVDGWGRGREREAGGAGCDGDGQAGGGRYGPQLGGARGAHVAASLRRHLQRGASTGRPRAGGSPRSVTPASWAAVS